MQMIPIDGVKAKWF